MGSQSKHAMDLQRATHHFRLLADATRLRLLLLLDQEELSVAELAAISQLAQPRVSTHLAKLKDAGLVTDRRDGGFGDDDHQNSCEKKCRCASGLTRKSAG